MLASVGFLVTFGNLKLQLNDFFLCLLQMAFLFFFSMVHISLPNFESPMSSEGH